MQALPQRRRDDAFVVLLATCDPHIAQELSRVFANANVDLLAFDNARDMLLTAAERPVDLVIFDPAISELKGVGILSVLKRFKPQTRVIALADDPSFETQSAMAQEGVLYQIQKPSNPRQISQVVEKVVEKLYARMKYGKTGKPESVSGRNSGHFATPQAHSDREPDSGAGSDYPL